MTMVFYILYLYNLYNILYIIYYIYIFHLAVWNMVSILFSPFSGCNLTAKSRHLTVFTLSTSHCICPQPPPHRVELASTVHQHGQPNAAERTKCEIETQSMRWSKEDLTLTHLHVLLVCGGERRTKRFPSDRFSLPIRWTPHLHRPPVSMRRWDSEGTYQVYPARDRNHHSCKCPQGKGQGKYRNWPC